MEVRRYGTEGPSVVLLHGGPGTPGYMAPIARGLEDSWTVLEPLQRHAGYAPLTVEVHVEDLESVLELEFGDQPVPLVGSSWGGLLALCLAARSPDRVSKLVLIGCGTWDEEARAELQRIRSERMTDEIRSTIETIEKQVVGEEDPRRRDHFFQAMFEAIFPLYCLDPITTDLEIVTFDSRGNQETWLDVLRLQEQGVVPEEFRNIECPVTMLHGDYDPHPGAVVRRALAPHVRDLTYQEINHCGHFPWVERNARVPFFRLLRDALNR